jgi:class 3 adenylate cyclase
MENVGSFKDDRGSIGMSKVIEESPLQAGRDAAARHAWREAFDLLTRADGSGDLTADDLMALGEAAWWIGKLDDCIAARERACARYIDDGNIAAAAVTALAIAQDYSSKLDHSIAAGWFGRAMRLLEDEPESAAHGHLSVMEGMAALGSDDHDAALEAARRTLDLGTKYADRDLLAFGLLLEGTALVGKGEVEEGLARVDEATVAAVSGELKPYSTGIIYCIAITITARIADYDRAGQWTEASKRWCERQSIAGFPGICRVHRAEIMRLRGSWAEAEQEARRALSELQNFNLEFAGHGFYELGEVRFHMGDLEGAADAFRQAHELGHEPQPGLALLRLAEGNPKAARAGIERALTGSASDRVKRARLLPAHIEILLTEGDVEAAERSVMELEEIVAVYDSNVLQATSLLARGSLQLAEGNAVEAVATLQRSFRLWRGADLPYEAARARMLLSIALNQYGDDDGAAMELGAAKSAFEKLGAVLDLRKAAELLGQEIGDGVPRTSVPGERTIKTFMFTDIVSSTNLVEALGDEAWEHLLSWHDQTLSKLFMVHCGEEVKHIGDGFFVAFDDPNEAVDCAVDIQKRLAAHRKEHGFAPRVRIGLHSAEATRKGRDYGGRGVHEAARIGALAQGGEILASKSVIKAASIRFPVSELRSVELKGVSEPVEVATIDAG